MQYYESREEKEKKLSAKQYFSKITQHLYDLINDYRIAKRVWKIQISMRVNFISSKDIEETRAISVWSDNVSSIMRGSDIDDIIREIFRSFLCNYQEELKIITGLPQQFFLIIQEYSTKFHGKTGQCRTKTSKIQ